MKKLAMLATLVLAVAFAASPASAFWTFQAISDSTMATCSGEDVGYDPSCDITAAWGRRVAGDASGTLCTASIHCGGIVKSCQAVPYGGFMGYPACYSLTTPAGNQDKVVCKSDLGFWAIYC